MTKLQKSGIKLLTIHLLHLGGAMDQFFGIVYLSSEAERNLLQMCDEMDLESSPCVGCDSKIPWSFKFCIHCGVENEHYDSDYDDLGDECLISHEEIRADSTDHIVPVYCSCCGVNVFL